MELDVGMSSIFQNVAQKLSVCVCLICAICLNSQKVSKNVGYFWCEICNQVLSKIAQSGHNGLQSYATKCPECP